MKKLDLREGRKKHLRDILWGASGLWSLRKVWGDYEICLRGALEHRRDKLRKT